MVEKKVSKKPPIPIDGSPVMEEVPQESKRELLLRSLMGEELFVSTDRVGYITMNDTGVFKTLPIHGPDLKHWIEYRYYREAGSPLTGKLCSEIMDVLAARAHVAGKVVPVNYRVAEYAGKWYVDLMNEQWEMVEIDAEGWRVVNKPEIKFRRVNSSMPLPRPVPCDNGMDLIRPLINVPDEDTFRLVVGWLVSCLTPRGPYPVMVINSRHDSGKTVTTRMLRTLIDPCTSPVTAVPEDPKSAMLAASNSHVLAMDNVSNIPQWLSDVLCQISTGCGFRVKKLYTNNEEVVIYARCAVIINSIQEVINNPDLGDRCLYLELPPIKPSCRMSETEMENLLGMNHPEILGWLLNCVSWYMATNSAFERPVTIFRMADYYRIMHVLETHLQWPPMSFAVMYKANRQAVTDSIIDRSLIGRRLVELVLSRNYIDETAMELLTRLNRVATEGDKASKGWPQTPEGFSKSLRAIAPNLEIHGVYTRFYKMNDRNKTRKITIQTAPFDEGEAAI